MGGGGCMGQRYTEALTEPGLLFLLHYILSPKGLQTRSYLEQLFHRAQARKPVCIQRLHCGSDNGSTLMDKGEVGCAVLVTFKPSLIIQVAIWNNSKSQISL